MKLIFKVSILVLGSFLTLSSLTPSNRVLAGGKPGVGANVNVNANDITAFTDGLGIAPSGTVRENENVYCIFNNWEDRDKYAKAVETYDTGRFSRGTQFGGRWYCALKHN